jgi:hypothetical protein
MYGKEQHVWGAVMEEEEEEENEIEEEEPAAEVGEIVFY